jgi:hypothetical protein
VNVIYPKGLWWDMNNEALPLSRRSATNKSCTSEIEVNSYKTIVVSVELREHPRGSCRAAKRNLELVDVLATSLSLSCPFPSQKSVTASHHYIKFISLIKATQNIQELAISTNNL